MSWQISQKIKNYDKCTNNFIDKQKISKNVLTIFQETWKFRKMHWQFF